MESKFATLEGLKIHYQVRGGGPRALLLLHGAVGSTHDFALQLDGAKALSGHQFTLVAPDLPGWGLSEAAGELRAEPTLEYLELCARLAAALMGRLGHKTYSVAGWSEGARVACLVASQCPSRVNALVLWGFLPQLEPESCWALARARDTSAWEPAALELQARAYGEERFSDLWRRYVDFLVAALGQPEPLDLRPRLAAIRCPTLVLHGARDPVVSFGLHVAPLEMHIMDSELRQLPGLAHNMHQADPAAFNQQLAGFVTGVCG